MRWWPPWQRSSRCDTGQCVEVAWWRSSPPGVSPRWMRDSKTPHGPVLAFDPGEWRALVADLKGDGLHDGSALLLKPAAWSDPTGESGVRVCRPVEPEVALFFTTPEWVAFVAGVRAGEFDD